mmetsp:Transcript_78826/g.139287  ORF Transcript_78826/g.139287 Transcript_78826/m.139287 type:complete len:232 (+) Transcript_78826:362-1057(+)
MRRRSSGGAMPSPPPPTELPSPAASSPSLRFRRHRTVALRRSTSLPCVSRLRHQLIETKRPRRPSEPTKRKRTVLMIWPQHPPLRLQPHNRDKARAKARARAKDVASLSRRRSPSLQHRSPTRTRSRSPPTCPEPSEPTPTTPPTPRPRLGLRGTAPHRRTTTRPTQATQGTCIQPRRVGMPQDTARLQPGTEWPACSHQTTPALLRHQPLPAPPTAQATRQPRTQTPAAR